MFFLSCTKKEQPITVFEIETTEDILPSLEQIATSSNYPEIEVEELPQRWNIESMAI